MDFEEFKKIITDNIEADKSELKSYINKRLSSLPIPTVQVNQNTFIERAVLISKEDEEFDLKRLSYIPDNIKHYAKEGRFNKDNEPTFYAAFTDLESPESTRFFLATELDHSILGHQNKTFNITVTKWLSTEGFSSVFLLFKKDFCTNSLTINALEQIKSREAFKNLTEEDIEFFELITEEISKKEPANRYTITNIIFDFYKNIGYKAIIYPGVRSRYRGNNIAMLPEITDSCWTCCCGAEFKLTQTGKDIKMDAIHKINLKCEKLVYSPFGKSEIAEGVTKIEK